MHTGVYHTIPKPEKKIDNDVEYLLSDYKERYIRAYWIGAYALYMNPETRKLLEDFITLNQELKSQKEKLKQLQPEYIELTNTISELEKEREQIDKKTDRMSNRISKLDIELDSVDDEIKRNKIIKKIESLRQEYDDLVERFINIGREIYRLRESKVIHEYHNTSYEMRKIDINKDNIIRAVYRIMEEML